MSSLHHAARTWWEQRREDGPWTPLASIDAVYAAVKKRRDVYPLGRVLQDLNCRPPRGARYLRHNPGPGKAVGATPWCIDYESGILHEHMAGKLWFDGEQVCIVEGKRRYLTEEELFAFVKSCVDTSETIAAYSPMWRNGEKDVDEEEEEEENDEDRAFLASEGEDDEEEDGSSDSEDDDDVIEVTPDDIPTPPLKKRRLVVDTDEEEIIDICSRTQTPDIPPNHALVDGDVVEIPPPPPKRVVPVHYTPDVAPSPRPLEQEDEQEEDRYSRCSSPDLLVSEKPMTLEEIMAGVSAGDEMCGLVDLVS